MKNKKGPNIRKWNDFNLDWIISEEIKKKSILNESSNANFFKQKDESNLIIIENPVGRFLAEMLGLKLNEMIKAGNSYCILKESGKIYFSSNIDNLEKI